MDADSVLQRGKDNEEGKKEWERRRKKKWYRNKTARRCIIEYG